MKYIHLALVLSAGAVIGYSVAILGGVVFPPVVAPDERGFDAEYELGRTLAFSNLITAVYWRQGMDVELGRYLDDNMLPNGLLFLTKNNRSDASSEYFAWRLKRYYVDNSLLIPPGIQVLLGAVPEARPRYAGRIAEAADPGELGRESLKDWVSEDEQKTE